MPAKTTAPVAKKAKVVPAPAVKKDKATVTKKVASAKKVAPKKKVVKKFFTVVIDCTKPVEGKVFDIAAFDTFLKQKIKVNGKAGALASLVRVTRDKTKVTIRSNAGFPKRYVKYLTKKFLKRNKLRDWLRVVASAQNTYELRFYNIQDQEEAEEEENQASFSLSIACAF